MSTETAAGGRTLTVSLVSHTNVGKTTLARTLLQRDVGEVLDQAHVTDVSEAHVLIATPEGEELVLWDTPGFGDTVRLLRRLRAHKNPLGWFLGQVWDRFADRPLWCSQQAVRNVQRDADVVLYLVSAAEDPSEAGYVDTEMALLDWIGRPVIVILTQIGPPRPRAEDEAEARRWSEALAHHPCLRDVLALDGFTRCWVQEGVLFEQLEHAIEPAQRPLFARLRRVWREVRLDVFRRSTGELAELLGETARDRVPVEGSAKKREKFQAMEALAGRLRDGTRAAMHELIRLHGLEGASLEDFRTELEDFHLPEAPVDPRRAGLIGGVVGGALTGLAADVMTGGLTLGGGMIAGGILGALGSAGLARGFQYLRGDKEAEISWSPEFLTRFLIENLLRYLAVAHYGRGRGDYRDMERPGFWTQSVEAAVERRAGRLKDLWRRLASDERAEREALAEALRRFLAETVREVLTGFYPEGSRVFGEELVRVSERSS